MKRFTMMAMLTGVVMLFLAGFACAAAKDEFRINKREARQQKRIEQGVKSGQLTEKEAGKLEQQQEKIKQDEAQMKADGKLTPAERRKLEREQNRTSKNIFRKKHNERKVDVK